MRAIAKDKAQAAGKLIANRAGKVRYHFVLNFASSSAYNTRRRGALQNDYSAVIFIPEVMTPTY
ncbi:hypothetical protein ACULNC_06210 [Shigella flexneri]